MSPVLIAVLFLVIISFGRLALFYKRAAAYSDKAFFDTVERTLSIELNNNEKRKRQFLVDTLDSQKYGLDLLSMLWSDAVHGIKPLNSSTHSNSKYTEMQMAVIYWATSHIYRNPLIGLLASIAFIVLQLRAALQPKKMVAVVVEQKVRQQALYKAGACELHEQVAA